jgi:hypothetical protein
MDPAKTGLSDRPVSRPFPRDTRYMTSTGTPGDLAARLRAENSSPPPPRKFTSEQVASWINQDEADMKNFDDGK